MAFCTVLLVVRVFVAKLFVDIQNWLSNWSDTVSAIAKWMANVAPVYGEYLYTKPTASALIMFPFFLRVALYHHSRGIFVLHHSMRVERAGSIPFLPAPLPVYDGVNVRD